MCRGNDWGAQELLEFAVELATAKVQVDGFQGLASRMSRLPNA